MVGLILLAPWSSLRPRPLSRGNGSRSCILFGSLKIPLVPPIGGGIYASLFGGGGGTCVRIGLPMGLKEKVSSSKTCPGSSLPNGASPLNPFGVGAW